MSLLQLTLLATTWFLATRAADEKIKCIERERQVLLKIKDDIVDDYGYLSSWSSAENDCCLWERVECSNSTGHVIGLYLTSSSWQHRMSGKISPSLIELEDLEVLDLSFNNFNGIDIPESFGSLTKLTYLNLHRANFSGRLSSLFQNLTNLQYLDLSKNNQLHVENLNHWLLKFSSLRTLDLSWINLRDHGWQQIINKLQSLESLKLSSCDLQDELPQCANNSSQDLGFGSSSLTYIDLSSNNLTGSIFKWLFTVGDRVMYLNLSNNPLGSSIPNISSDLMPFLTGLNLGNCTLEGGIPTSVGNICTLRDVVVDGNKISGDLIEIFGNLSGCASHSLENLILRNNQLRGSDFSLGLEQFTKLKKLDLSGNKLNGYFPSASHISRLFQLEELIVASNSLKGLISELHFANLSRLKILDLSYNSDLSLKVSSNWAPTFQLEVFRASSCRIGPNFPRWIQNQKDITLLDISSCGISDTMPSWFWDIFPNTAEYVNISYNQIRGRLPNSFSKIKTSELRYVDFTSNYFEGSLPSFPSNLLILYLGKNRFSGPLSSLCNGSWENLLYIDLSENSFFGEIPDCLDKFPALLTFHLEKNNLTGKIPNSIGSLTTLESVDLSHNILSGSLPLHMKNCSSLTFLDLGQNRFFGKIPSWIGKKLLALNFLLLPENQFSGSIPLELCNLNDIIAFDISMNNISGNMLPCFSNFTAMAKDRGPYVSQFGGLITMTHSPYHSIIWDYYDSATISWQGRDYEYKKRNLCLVNIINLSSNRLTGEIPSTLVNLSHLRGLNLSRNCFLGSIPHNIGLLTELEQLDLSNNCLSGEIPSSISDLSFLSYLNLSYNHLTGVIPLSSQIQSLHPSAFAGNLALCGPPMTLSCSSNHTQPSPIGNNDADESAEFNNWLLAGVGCGFFVGFCGVCFHFMVDDSVKHVFLSAMILAEDLFHATMSLQFGRLWRKVAESRVAYKY